MTSKLTPDRAQRVIEALGRGHFRHTAARLAGIVPTTLARWLRVGADYADLPGGEVPREYLDHVALHEACIQAEALAIDYALAGVRTAAGEDWRAAAWLLERRAREDWQPRKEVTLGLARTEKRLILDSATECVLSDVMAEAEAPRQVTTGSEVQPGPRLPQGGHTTEPRQEQRDEGSD